MQLNLLKPLKNILRDSLSGVCLCEHNGNVGAAERPTRRDDKEELANKLSDCYLEMHLYLITHSRTSTGQLFILTY